MKIPKIINALLGALTQLLLFAEIATAQSADHLLTLHSEITFARDRTLTVSEKFEFVNDAGSFADGFRRRLSIKAAGPHRAGVGGFQSISAQVDGSAGIVHTSENNDVFDMRIFPQSNQRSAGEHSIELRYTAKHQFLVYDDSKTSTRTSRENGLFPSKAPMSS
jgi:hypothetical protein